MGIGDVKRHIQGASHVKASKGMEMQKKSFYIHFHVTFIFDESQAFLGLITLILNSGLGRSEVGWSLPNRGAPAPVPPPMIEVTGATESQNDFVVNQWRPFTCANLKECEKSSESFLPIDPTELQRLKTEERKAEDKTQK